MKLGDLKLNPTNPRFIKDDKFKKLVASIKEDPEFLDARPIVVKDGVIFGGNMRWRALKELGYTEIPDNWVKDVSDWTDAQIRKFIVVDNLAYGDTDWDLLSEQYEKEELEDWGMDVDKWKDDEVVEDEVPEVSDEPPISKLGEVYQLGRHRLMCGDSTKIEDVEKLMDGNKADMVFTDPPYGVDFQSNMRTKSKKFDVLDNDDKILTDWIEPAITFSTGWILFCTTWKVLKQWLDVGENIGKLSNMIIWDKGGGGIGDLEHSLLTDYEIILAYNRGNKITGKRIGSVWDIGKDDVNSYKHPTQKPVKLVGQAIQSFCNGDVLDLFLGSGSTLIACEQTNRICYGMELDEKYVDVCRRRYWKFVNNGDETGWETNTPAIVI